MTTPSSVSDLLAADMGELTVLGRTVDRGGERPALECFTVKGPLTTQTHRTREWVSRHPADPDQPAVYDVAVVYAPQDGRIVEAKSLRELGTWFKTATAPAVALADQVAGEVATATRALWVEVTFRDQGGQGVCSRRQAADEVAASALPVGDPGAAAARARRGGRPQLTCTTVELPAGGDTRWIHQERWVAECPVPPYLTDIYGATIAYAPRAGQVLTPDSLHAYAASYVDTKAFAEALAGQVASDVLAATAAYWVEVTFPQNVRGGWELEPFIHLSGADTSPEPGPEPGRS